MLKSAFLIPILTDLSTVTVLESQESKNLVLLASISKVSLTSSGIIIGLTFKLCGAIGVITKSVSYTHLDVYKRQFLCKAKAK